MCVAHSRFPIIPPNIQPLLIHYQGGQIAVLIMGRNLTNALAILKRVMKRMVPSSKQRWTPEGYRNLILSIQG